MNCGDRVALIVAHTGGPGDYLLPAGSEGTVLDPFADPDEDPAYVVFDALPKSGRLVSVRDLRVIERSEK